MPKRVANRSNRPVDAIASGAGRPATGSLAGWPIPRPAVRPFLKCFSSGPARLRGQTPGTHQKPPSELRGDGDPDARRCGVNHLSLADLLAAPSRQGHSYAELLRVQALSAGVYELAAETDDLQEPHTEDEVYLVLRGRAQATVGGQTVAVTTGSFLYVPARVPHRFHDIEEDLAVFVLFAPAEGTGVG